MLRQPALARTIERARRPTDPTRTTAARSPTRSPRPCRRAAARSTAADLAAHAGEWAEPLRAAYRGVEVAELPPPTQGVTALEALRILDGFDLGALDAVTRASTCSSRR